MRLKDVIAENRKKTKIVLAIYLFIYTFIGFLLDTVLINSNENIWVVIKKLATFQYIPYATISMFILAVIFIFIGLFFFKRIQLSGENYFEITNSSNDEYKQLYNIVEELSIASRLRYIPKIYVIEANYMNAFASGWSKDNSMIAITTELLNKLSRSELEGVIAHELNHILNEDIKLTLVVGVVGNIMLFISDFAIYLFFSRGKSSDSADKAKIILLILHFILPVITILLQMWLSRSREYMADSGAAILTGNPNGLASALNVISSNTTKEKAHLMSKNVTRLSAYIYEPEDSLFSTHPSVKNRIKKLMQLK